jgi:hypothetical protein
MDEVLPDRIAACKGWGPDGRSRALARECSVYHRMVLSSDCVTDRTIGPDLG